MSTSTLHALLLSCALFAVGGSLSACGNDGDPARTIQTRDAGDVDGDTAPSDTSTTDVDASTAPPHDMTDDAARRDAPDEHTADIVEDPPPDTDEDTDDERGALGDPCDDTDSCATSLFCEAPLGTCQTRGVCAARPNGDDCPDVMAPVCGCDGVTYDNDCERQLAGASALLDAPCERPTLRCQDSADCAPGEICDRTSCGEDDEGLCAPFPLDCPMTQTPVCGCDGVTYDNDCERQRVGVARASNDRCEGAPQVCRDDVVCGPGERCECAGACGAPGQCVAIPQVCGAEVAPVCACDGQTYLNDCERQRAGTCRDQDGPCDTGDDACGGVQALTCEAPGAFCDVTVTNACGLTDLPGRCVVSPETCPRILEPVCGCDGLTYDNDCERQRAGVQKALEGPCPNDGRCGGPLSITCAPGQICDPAPNTCDDDEAQGLCVAQPQLCEPANTPVCGCDGVTYDSDCARLLAGRAKVSDGPCP